MSFSGSLSTISSFSLQNLVMSEMVESSFSASSPSSPEFVDSGVPALDRLSWRQSALFEHALKVGHSDPMVYAEQRSQMGEGLCFIDSGNSPEPGAPRTALQIRPIFESGGVALRDRVTALREFGGMSSPEQRAENIQILLRFLESVPDSGEFFVRNRILRLYAIEALSRILPRAELKDSREPVQWLLREARETHEACLVGLRKDLPETDPHRVGPCSADLRRPLRLLLFKALEEARKCLSSNEAEECRNLSEEISDCQSTLMLAEMMIKQRAGAEISVFRATSLLSIMQFEKLRRPLVIHFLEILASPKTPAFFLGALVFGLVTAALLNRGRAIFFVESAAFCASLGAFLMWRFFRARTDLIRQQAEARKHLKLMMERRKEIECLEYYRNYFMELDLGPLSDYLNNPVQRARWLFGFRDEDPK